MAIAKQSGFSHHKIAYWMDKHRIPRRTISEAVYLHSNPNGDPFKVKPIKTLDDAFLMGLGLGLYWGEGTKANAFEVRLGNSDPELLRMFMHFLTNRFGVVKTKLRFGLQVFTDINPDEALSYWVSALGVTREQFYKVHVTISGSLGTYRKKSKYGVVTIYFHNKKLRDIIVALLPR